MKMNRNEMEALYAFGCPNLKATVERLRMVAALAPDPVAKSPARRSSSSCAAQSCIAQRKGSQKSGCFSAFTGTSSTDL